MKPKTISQEALAVLSTCHQRGHVVTITEGKLDRALYTEVDHVLRAIGGKWSSPNGGHIFTEPASEVAEMLEACIQCGIATPLRPGSYFATPEGLGSQMTNLAEIGPDMQVLEPSAGDGQLATVIARALPKGARLRCFEMDPKLFRNLEQRFAGTAVSVMLTDFLKTHISFDRIIMNPPFQKLADIDHITHAWECLKPKGALVSVASASVTFRGERKAQVFRELVAKSGRVLPLPNNTFKPSGTLVNTVLVELRKAA